MENIFVRDILEMVGGTLLCGDENMPLFDLVQDSRKVHPGDLFVPLVGAHFDAHQFLADALCPGSAAFTMEHSKAEPYMRDSGASVIAVPDTLAAMQQVAADLRRRNPIPLVGVTGSVGKTTTREMIYTALSCRYHTFQTIRNYNSQVGVPLTLAKLSKEYEMAVLEMGISQEKEMERLADMIRPDAAVVTCIGVAHIENLKTRENICDEKLQIAKYMSPDAVLFLNGDDPILCAKGESLPQRIIWYGTEPGCDYRAEHVHTKGGQTVFDMVTPKGTYPVQLQAMGEHNARNALVAVAVAEQYGVPPEEAISALRTFHGLRQRVVTTAKFTMIDNTYNASPDSMQAELRALRDIPCRGRRIAVLADMLELGEKSQKYHEQIGWIVKDCGINYLITYGEMSVYIQRSAGIESYHAPDLEAVRERVDAVAKPEDVVMFMGSNGMKLSEVTKIFEQNL